MKYSRAISIGVLFLAVLVMNPARTSSSAATPETTPDQLVREVMHHEIQAELNDTNLWSYRDLTERHGQEVLLEYCQTKYGTIDRLLAVNGRPFGLSQRQAEDERIQKLIKSPNAIQASQKKEAADAREERKFLGLLPDAFRYQDEGEHGDLLTLKFTPNPVFRPSGYEAQALCHLQGTTVLDVKQKRLARIDGRLMTRVNFWGGLLGHLNQGGTFSVVSEEVAPDDWELKSLDVEMNGKALFFKTLTVRERDTYTNYKLVPPQTTLEQAAEQLKKDSRD
jgi:hypothetical protein